MECSGPVAGNVVSLPHDWSVELGSKALLLFGQVHPQQSAVDLLREVLSLFLMAGQLSLDLQLCFCSDESTRNREQWTVQCGPVAEKNSR